MRIILAPMEGVIDHTMRDMLTRLGGIDRCVTEFVRVSELLLPPRVFYRYCPELHTGATTPSGVPIYLQLLGGQPGPMAENAARAAELPVRRAPLRSLARSGQLLDAQAAQRRCNIGRLIGGLAGGGLGYAASRQDGRAWAIPLGALLGSQVGCPVAQGQGPFGGLGY